MLPPFSVHSDVAGGERDGGEKETCSLGLRRALMRGPAVEIGMLIEALSIWVRKKVQSLPVPSHSSITTQDSRRYNCFFLPSPFYLNNSLETVICIPLTWFLGQLDLTEIQNMFKPVYSSFPLKQAEK